MEEDEENEFVKSNEEDKEKEVEDINIEDNENNCSIYDCFIAYYFSFCTSFLSF